MSTVSPNILYLHSHDTGRLVQPYGHAVSTPHLQAFATQGVLFRRAFSVAPTCSPSRAALLTGMYPHSCGMHGLASPPWNYRLDCRERLLPGVLAVHGYLTALGGVHHIGGKSARDTRADGFQVLLNDDNRCEDVSDLHERAARFVSQKHAAPWFLAVGFDQTHRDNRQGDPASGACFSQTSPYDPRQLPVRDVAPPAPLPDTPETRRDLTSFAEGVRRLDERIGHVLAALERSGSAGHTLVIITTDHGAPFPGMKCNLTDHGLGVMLMLRGPGGFHGGRTIDAMVTHLDIFPTIAELAGIRGCEWFEGKSLLPLLSGDATPLHSTIFAEQGWHDAPEFARCVRTERYTFIRRADPVGPKAANCDEGPTKRVMLASGFFERELGRELLFDLVSDPHETRNRIDEPSLAGIRTELRESLHAWMRRTNDPFLRGEMVPPPGLYGTAQQRPVLREMGH